MKNIYIYITTSHNINKIYKIELNYFFVNQSFLSFEPFVNSWISIYGRGYIEREINAFGYKDLYIQFMFKHSTDYPLENEEYCGLYYNKNGNKIYLRKWSQSDIVSISDYHQMFYLPKLLDNSSDIQIGFDNNGANTAGRDRCYIKYAKLVGTVLNPFAQYEQYSEIW